MATFYEEDDDDAGDYSYGLDDSNDGEARPTVVLMGQKSAKEKDGEVVSPFDDNSYAVIRLKTDQVMFLRQLNKHLALVCVIRGENFEKQGLIDYNFNCFKEGIEKVFMVRKQIQEESKHSS
ncbi:Gtr1/RagA G protein region [Teladorsagia circumcincta]|uniref:Gtr1/RagA G protein region n=1 Tax=Teladorsagia circumcincta TaxID=45464 RepID=A0A2G9U4X4_TELCI|nr:Gtr1/RagA G protein region [Teladorsagia circumcincta]